MTGKVIDSGANSIPLLFLPLALIITVLFVAWPFIVAIFIFSLGYKLWERYRLKKLSEEIDPYFNKLVESNQGSLTILDITNQTDLSAKTARWYLDNKAEEYGAVKRLYEDKTIVYYFFTANALGRILDDSEPDDDSELETLSKATSQLNTLSSPTVSATNPSPTATIELTTTTKEEIEDTSSHVESSNPSDDSNKLILTQTDLAKRLEVSTSTIAKRKLDRDFGLWCQSRDPDGLPWEYVEETKMFQSY
jgi:hypothetical protein